jgi:hypothetical protein
MISLKSATNLEKGLIKIYSIKQAQSFPSLRYFCQVYEDGDTESAKGDLCLTRTQLSPWSHESCTSYSGRGSYVCYKCLV